MRQVNMTSLGDDARETLTIAVWKKPRNELWNNTCVYVLQRPGQLCASVDQYLRTTVNSGSQPTPMEIGAVMSTCACCGKAGDEKARCRFRNAKCSNCGKTAHLRAMCRQREKSAGKSSSSSSSGKSSGKGSASRGSTDKCCCCGRVGHRRPVCPRRNESCSHLWQAWSFEPSVLIFWWERKLLGLLRWNPLSLRWKEKFNTCGHCQSVCDITGFWVGRFLCFATTPIYRLTNPVTC